MTATDEHREGPCITVRISCDGCAHLDDRYHRMGGSYVVSARCRRVEVQGEPRDIVIAAEYPKTPEWCPFVSRADGIAYAGERRIKESEIE